jgi:hypothetical protein
LNQDKEKVKGKGSNLDPGIAKVTATEQRGDCTDEENEDLSTFHEDPFVFYGIPIFSHPEQWLPKIIWQDL